MNLATKTDCHDMAEILLKVAINPIQSINQSNITDSFISVIFSTLSTSTPHPTPIYYLNFWFGSEECVGL
jgi:hypothetical protein